MAGLLALSRIVDRITGVIGKNVSWLILAAVLISAGNASMRKAFDMSSNAWLEMQWYLYGTVFMLAAAYTLRQNEHIRIDIISNRLSKRTRDWVDLICHVFFLLPFAALLVYLCWPWFMLSFRSGEMSSNSGGLIIWPAKAMVLAGFILLLAQALSEIIKRAAVLMGVIDDPSPQHDLPPAAEAVIEMESDRRD